MTTNFFSFLNQPHLYEGDRTDNDVTSSTQTLQVVLPDRPDLRVVAIDAPSQFQAGGALTLDFDVINQGIVADRGDPTGSTASIFRSSRPSTAARSRSARSTTPPHWRATSATARTRPAW